MTSQDIRRRPAIAWLAICLFAGLLFGSILADPQRRGAEEEKLYGKCLKANEHAVEHLAPRLRLAALSKICTSILFHDKGPHAVLKGAMLDDALAQSERPTEGRSKRSIENPDESAAFEADKRGGKNRMLHFGKRNDGLDYETPISDDDSLQQIDEFIKRAGQERFMHFGKRAPNRFMHFGKRAPNRFMHFGKRSSGYDADKRADRFMHFGKRDNEHLDDLIGDDGADFRAILDNDQTKRDPNGRFMHFGKRQLTDDEEGIYNELGDSRGILKRSPSTNRYLHFGKKAANRFMHFGKRSVPEQQIQPKEKERNRRSIMLPMSDEGSSGSQNAGDILPAATKRFSLSYSSLPVRQALLQHKFNALSKDDLDTEDNFPQADNSLLDRIVRSEQYQMIRPRFQSRLTRPDRNVFLHFG